MFYPAEELLYVHWHDHLTGTEVIRGVEQTTHWRDQLHYSFILNDKSDSGGDWSDTLPWLQYEWLPAAVQAGVKAIACVFPPDFEHRFASQDFVKAARPYLAIELFDDLETALAWLAIQRGSPGRQAMQPFELRRKTGCAWCFCLLFRMHHTPD